MVGLLIQIKNITLDRVKKIGFRVLSILLAMDSLVGLVPPIGATIPTPTGRVIHSQPLFSIETLSLEPSSIPRRNHLGNLDAACRMDKLISAGFSHNGRAQTNGQTTRLAPLRKSVRRLFPPKTALPPDAPPLANKPEKKSYPMPPRWIFEALDIGPADLKTLRMQWPLLNSDERVQWQEILVSHVVNFINRDADRSVRLLDADTFLRALFGSSRHPQGQSNLFSTSLTEAFKDEDMRPALGYLLLEAIHHPAIVGQTDFRRALQINRRVFSLSVAGALSPLLFKRTLTTVDEWAIGLVLETPEGIAAADQYSQRWGSVGPTIRWNDPEGVRSMHNRIDEKAATMQMKWSSANWFDWDKMGGRFEPHMVNGVTAEDWVEYAGLAQREVLLEELWRRPRAEKIRLAIARKWGVEHGYDYPADHSIWSELSSFGDENPLSLFRSLHFKQFIDGDLRRGDLQLAGQPVANTFLAKPSEWDTFIDTYYGRFEAMVSDPALWKKFRNTFVEYRHDLWLDRLGLPRQMGGFIAEPESPSQNQRLSKPVGHSSSTENLQLSSPIADAAQKVLERIGEFLIETTLEHREDTQLSPPTQDRLAPSPPANVESSALDRSA